jgi:hypothetical protein
MMRAAYPLAMLFVSVSSLYLHLEPGDGLFLDWGLIYSAQFLLYLGAALVLARYGVGSLPLWILAGIGARVILWFSDPVLETDFYRYLWDGRVLANGINPYLFAPLDPALDRIDVLYRTYINWSQFRTIYPPVSQCVFALCHWVAPDSLLALKVVFTAFDLAAGFLLVRWLKRRNIDPRWSLLYFLNPLVLKEVANSAHLDTIPMFLSFAAIYLMSRPARRRNLFAWVLLALAVGSKVYPLVLVPIFLRLDTHRWRNLLLFVGVLVVVYLPFLDAGTHLLGGTAGFARYWVFNASLFQVTTWLFDGFIRFFPESSMFQEFQANQWPAKLFLGIVFVLAVAWRTRRLSNHDQIPAAALWTLGLLLIASPVVDAWYVLWLLPLAVLERHVPWLCFSFLVAAAYAWFYSRELAPAFRLVEYGIFYALLFRWHRRQPDRPANLSNS